VRHDPAVRQRVIGVRIGRRRRVAHEIHRCERPIAKIAVELAIVGQRDARDERVRRIDQQVGQVAATATAAPLPIRLRAVTRRNAREILLDVAAADWIAARGDRRNVAGQLVRRLRTRRGGEQRKGK
jgi:thioredoxin-like negative regulator of GroEL